jgi:hypothetical protein
MVREDAAKLAARLDLSLARQPLLDVVRRDQFLAVRLAELGYHRRR